MLTIDTMLELEQVYQAPKEAAKIKVATVITPDYHAIIDASPFVVLATSGPEGLDCSPRGDFPGFVRIIDETHLQIPDRPGNNRVDSLRNIIHDPRIALLFFVPGSGNTLRVNGRAQICIDPALLDSFAVNGKPARSVIVVEVEAVYFQCARAILRSQLWNPERFVNPQDLPSAGQMIANLTQNRLGGENYDRNWPQRAQETLY